MSLECCITGRVRVLFEKALSLNHDCIRASVHDLSSSHTGAGARVVCQQAIRKPETASLELWAETSYFIICHTPRLIPTYKEVIYIFLDNATYH